MPTNAELQTQVDRLTGMLAERDRKDAEAKAAEVIAAQASDDAKAAAERAQAAAAEREQIRRGSWVNHLLGQAKPDVPVNFAEIDAAIPKDEGQWPPGVEPSSFVLTGGARIRPEEKTDVANTTLGRMLAAMTPKLN
jgi:hypothetical protein